MEEKTLISRRNCKIRGLNSRKKYGEQRNVGYGEWQTAKGGRIRNAVEWWLRWSKYRSYGDGRSSLECLVLYVLKRNCWCWMKGYQCFFCLPGFSHHLVGSSNQKILNILRKLFIIEGGEMGEKRKGMMWCLLMKGGFFTYKVSYISIRFSKNCEIYWKPPSACRYEVYLCVSALEDHYILIFNFFPSYSKKLSKKHSKKRFTCILIHWADSLFQFS